MSETIALPADIEETVDRLIQLPADQRLAISRRLAESVAQEEVNETWTKEIGKRIREIENGDVQGIPADEVFREAEERLNARG
jgi:putative addiction module component (TIGR02574 family)